jgi:hypothetical protein
MDDFPGNLPGNSHSAKLKKQQDAPETPEASKEQVGPIDSAQKQYDDHQPEANEEPMVKKVVNGRVTTRKKPLSSRFKEMFAGDGEQTFLDHLINDVAIPRAQEMMVSILHQAMDGVKSGVEDLITGNRTSGGSRATTSYGTGRPVTNYNAPYRPPSARTTARTTPPAPRMTIRRSNRVQDIFFETREDGLDVLDELIDKIKGFGHCTVGDLYSAVGETPRSTDQSWGWDDLDNARVRRLATGEFQLVLPRPIDIHFES